jgi:hypothetical protein
MNQVYPASPTRNTAPLVGGILCIVSAGITLAALSYPLISLITNPNFNIRITGGVFSASGIVTAIFVALLIASILAIVGAISAIKYRNWLLSLIGAIASIFSFMPILGIIATILIATSKKEFVSAV